MTPALPKGEIIDPRSRQSPWAGDARYVAASAGEVGDTPLARRITGQRILFSRAARGETVVRGCHRLASDCRAIAREAAAVA